MRKRFAILAAAAFALSIFAGGCAREKAASPPGPAKKESAGKEKKSAPMARVKWFTGTITDLDGAVGTLTLKGPKGSMDFKAHEKAKKELDGLKIGDKVIVKHADEIALSIVKPGPSKNALAWKERESAFPQAQ